MQAVGNTYSLHAHRDHRVRPRPQHRDRRDRALHIHTTHDITSANHQYISRRAEGGAWSGDVPACSALTFLVSSSKASRFNESGSMKYRMLLPRIERDSSDTGFLPVYIFSTRHKPCSIESIAGNRGITSPPPPPPPPPPPQQQQQSISTGRLDTCYQLISYLSV